MILFVIPCCHLRHWLRHFSIGNCWNPTEVAEREQEVGHFEETLLEGAAGALAGSLPDPASPDIQDETHYVKCELLTQEAVRAKMQEMDAAMAQLHVTPPTGAWAFLKSNPGANLPSLEMLGSLLLASFLMEEGVRNRLQFRISLISDSQGNVAEPLDPEDANGYGSDATGPLSTRPPHSHRCDWGQAPWALISLSAQDGGLDSFFYTSPAFIPATLMDPLPQGARCLLSSMAPL